MRKDSLVILTVSVLVTAAVFSAAHYVAGREDRALMEAAENLEPLTLPEWPAGNPSRRFRGPDYPLDIRIIGN